MRLGGAARYVCEVRSEEDLQEALDFAASKEVAHRVIGAGSNIVWRDEGYDGMLIVNHIEGFEILENGVSVRIGAGMPWDDAVAKAVDAGLSGIEFLSLIPGTSGATPVQNVGAYGSEIKDVLTSLRAYDTVEKKYIEISKDDCHFGYRTSRFKTDDAGRFVITSITLKLTKDLPQPPFYEVLQAYFDEHPAEAYTPQIIRTAVIRIRSSRLPDPAVDANNGSFFANPIVSPDVFTALQAEHPGIKGWPFGDGVKLAAGWLVDNAGFRDTHDEETGMATWAKQNLVLINENARTTSDLLKFRQKIIDAVQEQFGVTLEQEPELLP